MAKLTDHYAIAIGVDGYTDLPRLCAAGSDAKRFARWLADDAGGRLPDENIRLLLSPKQLPGNALDALPVRNDVKRWLKDIGIRNWERIGRRLYFYFAGHGFGPQPDEIGMLFADASNDTLPSDNIGLRPYRNFFAKHGFFDEVIFIVDCCRDPLFDLATNGPDYHGDAKAGPVPNVVDFVITAAPWGEKAWQAEDAQTGATRGLLTAAVLEGLEVKDARALDGLGRVTAASLWNFVKKRVPELAEAAKLKQTPKGAPPADEIILAIPPVDKIPITPTRIVVRPNLPGDLVLWLQRGPVEGKKEIARTVAANATEAGVPWVVPLLPFGFYTVEHVPTTFEAVVKSGPDEPHLFRFNVP